MLNQFLHLDTFAKLTGTCVEDLQSLNPHLKKNAIPQDGKGCTIKIPRSAKEKLTQNRKAILDSALHGKKELEALAKATGDYTYGRDRNVYYVRNGDVLGTIAQRFGVSIRNLREWNNLRGNLIRVGQRSIIWANSSVKINRPTFNTSSVERWEDCQIYCLQSGNQPWGIQKNVPDPSMEKIGGLTNWRERGHQKANKSIIG